MFEYRITKYNPIFRVNGIYSRDDWTSICDVGKKYNGCTLTTDECTTVMSNYVNCIMEIIATAQVPEFTVSDVEVYNIKYKRKFRSEHNFGSMTDASGGLRANLDTIALLTDRRNGCKIGTYLMRTNAFKI